MTGTRTKRLVLILDVLWDKLEEEANQKNRTRPKQLETILLRHFGMQDENGNGNGEAGVSAASKKSATKKAVGRAKKAAKKQVNGS